MVPPSEADNFDAAVEPGVTGPVCYAVCLIAAVSGSDSGRFHSLLDFTVVRLDQALEFDLHCLMNG